MDTENKPLKYSGWAIFFIALALYMFFSLPRINQPVAQDDLHWLVAAQSLSVDGIARKYASPDDEAVFSPHLYPWCLAFTFKIFGTNEMAARLFGFFCGLATIIMVFFVTRSFARGNSNERLLWASICTLLYATIPAVVQGFLILSIDNTLLTPAVLLLFWSYSEYMKKEKLHWIVICGFAMTLALWGRITTPPVAAMIIIFYTIIRDKNVKFKLPVFFSIFAGLMLFLVSWYVYCVLRNVQFIGPLDYTLSSLTARKQTVVETLKDIIPIVLWIGIFPIMLMISIVAVRIKDFLRNKKLQNEDIFLLGGLVIFCGYTVVGGTIFGYPKYHSPSLPLLTVYTGIMLSAFSNVFKNIRLHTVILVILIALAIQFFIVGDLLYFFRYSLRYMMAFSNHSSVDIIKSLVFKMSVYSGIFIILFLAIIRFSSLKNFIGLLLVLSLGSSWGTCLLQTTAHYYTHYNYGCRGTREAAGFIRNSVPCGSVVIAPGEIIYYMKLPRPGYISDSFWYDIRKLEKKLSEPNTSGLVYSIATNTVNQIRAIEKTQSIQNILTEDYNFFRIESYMVWIKK